MKRTRVVWFSFTTFCGKVTKINISNVKMKNQRKNQLYGHTHKQCTHENNICIHIECWRKLCDTHTITNTIVERTRNRKKKIFSSVAPGSQRENDYKEKKFFRSFTHKLAFHHVLCIYFGKYTMSEIEFEYWNTLWGRVFFFLWTMSVLVLVVLLLFCICVYECVVLVFR